MIGFLTAVGILIVTALMSWLHNHRRQVREKGVRQVRAAIAPWLKPDLAAVPQQPTGGDPPTSASGCSRTAGSVTQTSGPAVPARAHLELRDLPVDHGHHLGCAS